MDFATILKLMLDLGALGVVSAILTYVLWKYLPDREKDFRECLEESHRLNQQQAKDFFTALQQIQIDHGVQLRHITESLQSQRIEFLEALTKEREAHGMSGRELVSQLSLVQQEIKLQTASLIGALREKK